MITLNDQQGARLAALKLERDVQHLGEALAACFPEVPGRLGERWPLLLQLGLQRAGARGLTHAACVGRYLACWFMLGAEFDTKPAYPWAAAVLGGAQDQGARIFQLCRRVREELGAPVPAGGTPAPLTAAAFDEALAGVDQRLADRGELGSLKPAWTIRLGSPCDVDAIDLRLPGGLAPTDEPHQYRFEQSQWKRVPVNLPRSPVTLTAQQLRAAAAAGQAAGEAVPLLPALPPYLHLMATPPARGPEIARLRVRHLAQHGCSGGQHPLFSFTSPQGRNTWRGPEGADLTLSLPAEPAGPAEGEGPQPVMGAERPQRIVELSWSSCGLREDGPPMGTQTTRVVVHAGDQHLLAWRREAPPPVTLPRAAHELPPTPTTRARVRLERDGLPLDGAAWQAGFDGLDRQVEESLQRLATAWERESGVGQGRLQAHPRILCGHAGLSWGLAESPLGLAQAPLQRIAGQLDLIACALDLQFSGTLALHGSLSRLELHAAAQVPLQLQFERRLPAEDPMALLARAQCSFTVPFVLRTEPLADASLALLDAAGPVQGVMLGSAGLRQRPQGWGWQWFARLELQPLSVLLSVQDPLLGTRLVPHPLLPAMTVLDWSLG